MKGFISVAWLVAAPLVILLILFAIPVFVWLVMLLAELVFGPEGAQTVYGLYFLAIFFIALAFWPAAIITIGGLLIYAAIHYMNSKAKNQPER